MSFSDSPLSLLASKGSGLIWFAPRYAGASCSVALLVCGVSSAMTSPPFGKFIRAATTLPVMSVPTASRLVIRFIFRPPCGQFALSRLLFLLVLPTTRSEMCCSFPLHSRDRCNRRGLPPPNARSPAQALFLPTPASAPCPPGRTGQRCALGALSRSQALCRAPPE